MNLDRRMTAEFPVILLMDYLSIPTVSLKVSENQKALSEQSECKILLDCPPILSILLIPIRIPNSIASFQEVTFTRLSKPLTLIFIQIATAE